MAIGKQVRKVILLYCRFMQTCYKPVFGLSDKVRLKPVSLATCKDLLENLNFACIKFRFNTFQNVKIDAQADICCSQTPDARFFASKSIQ